MGKALTEIQAKSLKLIGNRNDEGMGARMPYHEMIVAADELCAIGFAEYRNQPPASAGRWLTPAGRAALSEGEP